MKCFNKSVNLLTIGIVVALSVALVLCFVSFESAFADEQDVYLEDYNDVNVQRNDGDGWTCVYHELDKTIFFDDEDSKSEKIPNSNMDESTRERLMELVLPGSLKDTVCCR